MSSGADTPMFRQYMALKAEHPDALLFYRMGDFYELFFEDARIAAEVLEITLTSRNRRDPDPVPMCGVPKHAGVSYLRRLVDAGYKVAIAEQVEDPRLARGLVERRIVRVVSPGVVLDPDSLEAREPNYLVGVIDRRGGAHGVAFLDVSTGELRIAELRSMEEVCGEIARLRPREAVIPADLPDRKRLEDSLGECLINRLDRAHFAHAPARRRLLGLLKLADLAGLGVEEMPLAVAAGGALIRYAQENSRSDLRHITGLRPYHPSGHMVIDSSTSRNLEIHVPLWGTGRKGTLLGLLDRTSTAMGGRLLREWLGFPLLEPAAIRQRLDAVEHLADQSAMRNNLREGLRHVADLERIGSKLAQATAHARDLAALARSLEALPNALQQLQGAEVLAAYVPQDLCVDVLEEIQHILVEAPPQSLTEGGVIRSGADTTLDELIHLSRKGKGAIAEMEQREKEATGISSLKIRHHRTQGYFLEVTRAKLHLVPEHYRRWQTLTNVERFVTAELKEFEEKVLTADARRKTLEYELFTELRDRVALELPRLQLLARGLATLDVFACLAELAVKNRYCRPVVDTSEVLHLVDARHPVVETTLQEERFVPNTIRLEPDTRRLVVLTGPNMSGKSTAMRQVALIVLLAQIGSFVPAKSAHVGVCDRIFVRVGASDDLARGRSTFMVEMAETSNILHNASARSLVLLDEIGRGTSTYDGLAIAWAVAEVIHDKIRCRTIFATHYHELVGFARKHPRATNMRVAVSQMGDSIIFLRRLQDGATSRSYGIQCAQLAGIPLNVVQRARQLLRELERRNPRDDRQLSLFDLEVEPGLGEEEIQVATGPGPEAPSSILTDAIKALKPDNMSPREALETLYRLKSMV